MNPVWSRSTEYEAVENPVVERFTAPRTCADFDLQFSQVLRKSGIGRVLENARRCLNVEFD